MITGVRAAESAKRKKQKMVDACFKRGITTVKPIFDWDNNYVWEFINNVACIPHCCLYDEGLTRIGCIGCPMATNAEAELERWPKIKAAYVRAFDRMLAERHKAGFKTKWTDGEDVMRWWLGKSKLTPDEQLRMEFEDEEMEDAHGDFED